MNVAVFGATGFVGSYLIDALVDQGMNPVTLVRPGSEDKLRHRDACKIISGDIADDDAVAATIAEADAAIYSIGILREAPNRGVTFSGLQFEGLKRVVDAAKAIGIQHFVLISANGIDVGDTPYQKTKRDAEAYLAASGLSATILRPSVIFGDPRGRMEFATQLYGDVIKPPLPAPLFYPGVSPVGAGTFELSPVHVEDVAAVAISALDTTAPATETLTLGGPETLTWKTILQRIAEAGGRSKVMLPVPASGVGAIACLFERFEAFPITRDQIRMLLQGNAADSSALESRGISPSAFDSANLAYLATPKGAST